MHKELLESDWLHAKESLRERWSELTEEDLKEINGRYDLLVDKLELRCGYSKEKAEEEVQRWNFENTEAEKSTYSSSRKPSSTFNTEKKSDLFSENKSFRKEEDAPSSFKWLLAIAIPLLLIALYFSITATPEITPVPYAAYEDITIYTENPVDRPLSQTIHQTLVDNRSQLSDLKTVHISTSNGVVTVKGSVTTTQERDKISSLLNSVSGVKQVNNQLEIKP